MNGVSPRRLAFAPLRLPAWIRLKVWVVVNLEPNRMLIFAPSARLAALDDIIARAGRAGRAGWVEGEAKHAGADIQAGQTDRTGVGVGQCTALHRNRQLAGVGQLAIDLPVDHGGGDIRGGVCRGLGAVDGQRIDTGAKRHVANHRAFEHRQAGVARPEQHIAGDAGGDSLGGVVGLSDSDAGRVAAKIQSDVAADQDVSGGDLQLGRLDQAGVGDLREGA